MFGSNIRGLHRNKKDINGRERGEDKFCKGSERNILNQRINF